MKSPRVWCRCEINILESYSLINALNWGKKNVHLRTGSRDGGEGEDGGGGGTDEEDRAGKQCVEITAVIATFDVLPSVFEPHLRLDAFAWKTNTTLRLVVKSRKR